MSGKDPIRFFKDKVSFRFHDKEGVKKWLHRIIKKNKGKTGTLNYIFCSDKEILRLNKTFLKHNYYTDIITFDNSEVKSEISADIYISADSVRKNAEHFKTTFRNELLRVMVHGLLHLFGQKDKTLKEKLEMRELEDLWLDDYLKNKFKARAK
ncbi:MAG: rRNA maturation RNase YbeY [Bacteroidetes bacterium]|nr:MAG: rRNA maturation RNase YbeY [Bacteroidota bacterium]REK00601.1 MAG: rRNA maturation RNase YbeY [Bacteroidota bacterium]REK35277.1 MAG: rRNA maturation RNase YbeY [Bacteroidota bacterium]REK48353.1 MAG: rRNA maturation RNase YbeY [Bacteroidota bacterium]